MSNLIVSNDVDSLLESTDKAGMRTVLELGTGDSPTFAGATVTDTLTAPHIHGNIAGSVYAHIRAGENLAKGDPVYVSGSHGSGSTLIPIVSRADASNAAKMPAIGIMDEAVANNANGHMVIVGTITELDTAGLTVNAELYVAAGGGMTATPPTARAQPVARVERANANNGAVIVKVNGLSASDATSNTLVRRDANGGASFNGTLAADVITANSVNTQPFTISEFGNIVTFDVSADVVINALTYTYGTGAASAHRTALGLGATGSIAASDPLTVTQTWTDAAVTYTGLQVNVTDTASNAASLLMDLQVGGVSRASVRKNGRIATFDGIECRSNGFLRLGSGGDLSWASITDGGAGLDLRLHRDAANTLAQRNGTAAQESRIYGTYTGPGNYRRLALKMSNAGVAQIVAEGAGSGAAGNVLELPANTTFADSSATRTALGLGATGSIAASDPLTLTQTWTDAAVTYTGLQVNVTDTASAAASLLMDLRVSGVSRLNVTKNGVVLGGGTYSTVICNGFQNGAANPTFFVNPFTGNVGLGVNTVLMWGSGAAPLNNNGDLYLQRDASGTLAQRNGTAAQESRIYGTYSGAGANYRRLALKMSTAGVAQIVAEGGGSGALLNRIEIDGLRIGKGGSDVATNTALGASALNANTTGGNNSAVGYFALLNNTTGNDNSAVGREALYSNTTGGGNSAVGRFSLYSNTTGSRNSAVGDVALRSNTTGNDNSAVGREALYSNTTGGGNSAVGRWSLYSNTTGGSNNAIGFNAGRFIADGTTANAITNNSVYLGADTKALANNQTNQIVIGHNATGLGSNTAVLGNDSIVTTALKGNVGIGTTSPTSKLTVTGGDIEVTDSASGIILKSPDGTRYRVTVSDLGVLSAASL